MEEKKIKENGEIEESFINNELSFEKSLNKNGEIFSEFDEYKTVLPVSKNMLKKMKRKEDWDNKKKDLKNQKKMRKKEKKLQEKSTIEKQEINTENIQNNIESNNDEEINENKPTPLVNLSKKVKEEIFLNKVNEGIVIILDCGFEELMNEKDIGSLVIQIAYCYSVNRKSKNPFNFVIYDIGPKVKEILKKNNFDKWVGIKTIEKGEFKSIDEFVMNYTNSKYSKENIIYLTADSENEINDLVTNQVYIIGGIVDRNRFKSITYKKAKDSGIGHGKLPIGEYIHLNSSKVLTTNHVFSILSHFNNVKKDWKESFLSIIPKRKLEE